MNWKSSYRSTWRSIGEFNSHKGIFSILPGSRERQYQYTLEYFLNPQKPHGFGYSLLETFLYCVGLQEFNLTAQHIEIGDEVRIADDGSERRIDLVICGGNALADHPRWAVFLELKVGADEGDRQTTTYAEADEWNLSWFDTGTVTVDRLDDAKYVYLKRAVADGPTDRTGKFDGIDWAGLVERFEVEIRDSLFEYPNRSVIQFTDFIRSLKETEGMDSEIDEDELNERLNLYFEHDRLIRQVEKANSQFESDFENVSTYLKNSWESEIIEKYHFDESGWKASPSSNPKWQGILPAYWDQNPLGRSSTIKLYFRHSPTTESLRNRRLTFRLRLPPARNVHTEKRYDGQSFNDVFAEKCTIEYEERLHESLETIGVDERRLGSASALVVKNYRLDPHNLTGSYFEQLERAVDEFCCDENGLLVTINEVFEQTYLEVFGEEPAGAFPGPLVKRQ
ncbi:PD-(D/E)XK nuclease family protein [Natronosalvus rutilus]|uniref:PD-(D/E)XK nuclease family protein n=1 Tax=Natronosalvus rutilus TaxID=2953753 RepID=A0A9E7ND03_9EURY|nr:PD-(D/E)XK nuclease family protein [Natronosalvus rutilus]UTF55246.1 PD-(D/E)XK nuclease family protein [Natronosalvus rutilus]